jgi:hypothetical protein
MKIKNQIKIKSVVNEACSKHKKSQWSSHEITSNHQQSNTGRVSKVKPEATILFHRLLSIGDIHFPHHYNLPVSAQVIKHHSKTSKDRFYVLFDTYVSGLPCKLRSRNPNPGFEGAEPILSPICILILKFHGAGYF